MKKYEQQIKMLKRLQLALLAVCVIGAGIILFLNTRPELSSYLVKDDCGPIGGAISHSIDDEDSCMNGCTANCLSLKQTYYDSKFDLSSLGCNSCNCTCKQ
ncbi:MAG: hypothetical protein ABIJ34_04530 [archaeon]